MVKITCCSWKGPGISFWLQHGDSQTSVTLVARDPIPRLASGGTACTRCTHGHVGKTLRYMTLNRWIWKLLFLSLYIYILYPHICICIHGQIYMYIWILYIYAYVYIQVWWYLLVIIAFRKLRQENYWFNSTLAYKTYSIPVWDTQLDPVS